MKMAILPKAIYRFKAIPIKMSTQFFTDLERTILNFMWEKQKTNKKTKITKNRISKTILYNKGTFRGITMPDIKLYYRD